MQIKLESIKFKPYTIPSIKEANKLTLINLLSCLFTEDVAGTNQFQDIIDSQLLLHIAYGLPAVKIDGYINPSSVIEIMQRLHQQFLDAHKHNLALACQYFLNHFLKATQKAFDGLQKLAMPDTEQPLVFIDVLFNQLDQLNKKQKKQLINDVVHDIRLINRYGFLDLETPLSPENVLTDLFNKLVTFIGDDINSTIDDPSASHEKVYAYLKMAGKLLETDPVPDFHGAGAITLALDLRHDDIIKAKVPIDKETNNKWSKLDNLFSPKKNYKPLRLKMELLSIPALWVITKSIHFSLENHSLLHRLEVTGMQYLELAEKRRRLVKKIPLESMHRKTNLLFLLKMDPIQTPKLKHAYSSLSFFTQENTESICDIHKKKEERDSLTMESI